MKTTKFMRRGFAPIIIIALIAAFLIGIAATVGYFKLKPQPTTTPQSTSTPADLSSDLSAKYLSSVETQVLEDKTANWKTFSDNKFGVSFKYPPSWKIKLPNTDAMCNEDTIFLGYNSEALGGCGSSNFALVTISNGVRVGYGGISGCENEKTIKSLIGGKQALKCEYENSSFFKKRIEYYFPEDKFAILYTQQSNYTDQQTIFNQILSTFQFLE